MKTYGIILLVIYILDLGYMLGKSEESLNEPKTKVARLGAKILSYIIVLPYIILSALLGG